MLSKQNSGIKAAYDELETLYDDDEKRAIYEAREEGIKEGIKEGIRKEKLENARKMLLNGADIEFIMKITDLTREEILNLNKI